MPRGEQIARPAEWASTRPVVSFGGWPAAEKVMVGLRACDRSEEPRRRTGHRGESHDANDSAGRCGSRHAPCLLLHRATLAISTGDRWTGVRDPGCCAPFGEQPLLLPAADGAAAQVQRHV